MPRNSQFIVQIHLKKTDNNYLFTSSQRPTLPTNASKLEKKICKYLNKYFAIEYWPTCWICDVWIICFTYTKSIWLMRMRKWFVFWAARLSSGLVIEEKKEERKNQNDLNLIYWNVFYLWPRAQQTTISNEFLTLLMFIWCSWTINPESWAFFHIGKQMHAPLTS